MEVSSHDCRFPNRSATGLESKRLSSATVRASFPGLLLMLALFGGLHASRVAAQSSSYLAEYKLKSVFIYNFVQFVDWPKSSFTATNSPIVIGVVGVDPFGSLLEEVVKDETVKGHPLRVERFPNAEAIQPCHVLFISRSERDRLPAVFQKISGLSVFTVSDIDRFAERGGIVNFAVQDGKLRYAINIDAAKDAGLNISSKLLRLARIVEPSAGK
jgi:hypothetical protein